MHDLAQLSDMAKEELRRIAHDLKLESFDELEKNDLIKILFSSGTALISRIFERRWTVKQKFPTRSQIFRAPLLVFTACSPIGLILN